MPVIGLDHIYLSVSSLERSIAFYDVAMQILGFRKGDKPIAGEPHVHYFTPSVQLSLRPARARIPHDPYAPGLHHLCLQMDSRTSVDDAAARLTAAGIGATPPRLYPEYHPEYYATFFRDPDELRLELVSRTSHRDAVAAHWDELTEFLNPLAEYRSRSR